MVRVSQFRFLVTSLGFLPAYPTKVYEDNAAVVTSITTKKITPRLRNIDLPLCYLCYEHTKEVFQAVQNQSLIQIANMETKPKYGPIIMRSASIAMGHTHIQDLSAENYAELIKLAPLSFYKHYSRSYSPDKTGQIFKIF